MNISGVVVRTYPRHIDNVSRALSALEGVEVHGANDDGRLVVTIERPGEQGLTEALEQLQAMPQVLSTSLVYHQFEELEIQEDEE